jgi:hypothetical protein
VRTVAAAGTQAASAYIYYLEGLYDEAEHRLHAALGYAEAWETAYDEPRAYFYRLHLAENMIKIERHRNASSGIRLALELLMYLSGRGTVASLPGTWALPASSLPKANVRLMFLKLIGELAHCTACAGAGISHDLVWPSLSGLLDTENIVQLHPEAIGWIRAKQAVTQDCFRMFHTYSADILRHGPSPINAKLWCSLSLDLLAFACRSRKPARTWLCYIEAQLTNWHFCGGEIDSVIGVMRN